MKLNINTFLVQPSKSSPSIEKVGVEEAIVEDVDSFNIDDNGITVLYNSGKHDHIPLRSNDGEDNIDWRAVNIFVTRKFLEVDLTK